MTNARSTVVRGDLRVTLARPLADTPAPVYFPRKVEIEAWRLREQAKLTDGAIAQLQNTTRETVNRRINRFLRKVHRIRQLCGGDEDVLLRQLLN